MVDDIQIALNETDGFSQEIRIASPDDQALRWIIGGAYRNRTNAYLFGGGSSPNKIFDDGFDSRPDINGLLAQDRLNSTGNLQLDIEQDILFVRDNAVTDSTDFGVFAFGSYDLSDSLELTAALRYDETKREQTFIYATAGGSQGTREAKFSEVQPKLGVSWQANDDILAYANYSRGFRTGGLNNPGYTLSPNQYDEEISDSFEIGSKTTWYDGRLIVNGAVFMLDVEGYQFSEFASTIGNTNIAEADIKGFELEMQARPTENLTINMGYGYTDAKQVRFTADPLDRPNLDNKLIPFVPPYTFNFGIAHDKKLGRDLDLRTFVSYRRSGRTYHRADNDGSINTQEYWDARVSLSSERWTVSAFVDNVFDVRSPVHFFLSGTVNPKATPNQPRSVGVSAKYFF